MVTADPPVNALYHAIVPPDAVAPSCTVPEPVLEPEVVLVMDAVSVVATVLDGPAQPVAVVVGVTVIFPAVVPVLTVTEFVVPPAVCNHPEGKVHM